MTIPAVGTFAVINFGANATQYAYVAAMTRTGRAKVRAWNSTRQKWMPNFRTLDSRDFAYHLDAKPAFLPNPPDIAEPVGLIHRT